MLKPDFTIRQKAPIVAIFLLDKGVQNNAVFMAVFGKRKLRCYRRGRTAGKMADNPLCCVHARTLPQMYY